MAEPAPLGEYHKPEISQDVKIAVAARDAGKSRECGSNEGLQFDHVIPWSRGGANTLNNVHLLRGECNRRKGARLLPEASSETSLDGCDHFKMGSGLCAGRYQIEVQLARHGTGPTGCPCSRLVLRHTRRASNRP